MVSFQSALLVIVASQFLNLVKSSVERLGDTPSTSALMALIYSAILFNMGATVASFVLTDRLSDMALFASQKKADPPTRGYTPYTNSLLQLYGLGRAWRWLIFHCERIRTPTSSEVLTCYAQGLFHSMLEFTP